MNNIKLPTPQEIFENPEGVYVPDTLEGQMKQIDNLLSYMMIDLADKSNVYSMVIFLKYALRNIPLVAGFFFRGIMTSKSGWKKCIIPAFSKEKLQTSQEFKDTFRKLRSKDENVTKEFQDMRKIKPKYLSLVEKEK